MISKFQKWIATHVLITLFVGVSSVFGAPTPAQIKSLNFDFDDNIFVTPAQVMVWDVAAQKEVGISTADWAIMKLQIAGQGLVLRADGLRFASDSTAKGDNLFASQIEVALHGSRWKGPSWDSFVKSVSDPKTRPYTTIITARLHSPDSIYRGLQVLQNSKDSNGAPFLSELPAKENIFPVLWPDFPQKFRGDSPQTDSSADRKAKVMAYLLDQIEEIPLPETASQIQNQNATAQAALHTWGFSDDDYNNIFTAYERLSPMVKSGRWPHIKIMLFFTGLNNPVHKSHAPFVIKTDGTLREGQESEDPREL